MKTARLLGINEVNINKIRDGLMPKVCICKVCIKFKLYILNPFLYLSYFIHNRM